MRAPVRPTYRTARCLVHRPADDRLSYGRAWSTDEVGQVVLCGSLGKPANLAGGIVRPHQNGLAHGKPPQFAILNHDAIDSGIPGESATQRVGITQNFIDHRDISLAPKVIPELCLDH